jgi:hypothetical protein
MTSPYLEIRDCAGERARNRQRRSVGESQRDGSFADIERTRWEGALYSRMAPDEQRCGARDVALVGAAVAIPVAGCWSQRIPPRDMPHQADDVENVDQIACCIEVPKMLAGHEVDQRCALFVGQRDLLV